VSCSTSSASGCNRTVRSSVLVRSRDSDPFSNCSCLMDFLMGMPCRNIGMGMFMPKAQQVPREMSYRRRGWSCRWTCDTGLGSCVIPHWALRSWHCRAGFQWLLFNRQTQCCHIFLCVCVQIVGVYFQSPDNIPKYLCLHCHEDGAASSASYSDYQVNAFLSVSH
jgi:hypothetical protein